jgi:hypothetical protein
MKYEYFKFKDGNIQVLENILFSFQIEEYIKVLKDIHEVYENIITKCEVKVPIGVFRLNSRGKLYIDPVTKKTVEEVETKYLIKTYEGLYLPYPDWKESIKIYVIGACDFSVIKKESEFFVKDTLKYLGEINFDGNFEMCIFIVNGKILNMIDGSKFC